jgi:hypothetical protein
VVTLYVALSVERDGIRVPLPDVLEAPGAAETASLAKLHARLSSTARKAFDSSDVRAGPTTFTDIAPGRATAIVRVNTQETAKLSAAGFASGTTTLDTEVHGPLCTYVRELVGGAPPATVTASTSIVQLGEGAVLATVEEGGAEGADALSSSERRAARWVCGIGLVLALLLTGAILGLDWDFPALALTPALV